jgi:hypothetical protein
MSTKSKPKLTFRRKGGATMTSTEDTGTGATGVPGENLPVGVADKLREILTDLEARDRLSTSEAGTIELSIGGGALWKVSYETSAQ